MSKIFKTLICIDNQIFECDTILWHGQYWFVPEWLVDQSAKKQMPERIIALVDQEQIRPASSCDFQVGEPIPKEVWDGTVTAELRTKYQLINLPDIWVDTPEFLN